MRAVKINPVSRTVTEINLKKNPNNTLQELYEIIGCDLVEMVQIDRDMVMVVDENGKCKDVQGAFTFIGWGTVIAGTGIVLGGNSSKLKALQENLASFEMIGDGSISVKVVLAGGVAYRQAGILRDIEGEF